MMTILHISQDAGEREEIMSFEIVVPQVGESIVEATVAMWLKHEGDRVVPGEPVVEIETEKANQQIVAEHAGVLVRIERKDGEDVKMGDVLGIIEEMAEAVPASTPAPAVVAQPTSVAAQGPSPATPVAKRMAQVRGIDLDQVPASSTSGKVTKRDVENYLQGQVALPLTPAQPLPAAKQTEPAAPAPAIERRDREERVRMSRRRQTIARRLLEAAQTTAMLTTFNEINMSAVMDIRKRRKDAFKEQHSVSLGLMSFFVKASIGALKAFPRLNAEIQGDDIVFKHYYDIGIAVGASEGLVVPVLRDADRMSFAEIEQAIKMFAQKAEQNTLTLEDLRGGTFTITNGGVFGSLLSTPILNPPQVGILGLHKIEERPIVLEGQVVVRPMMYVALSYDHRIVDGREAVQFLVCIKELIEDPETLLLEG
jgi:2-oxoglutarate dehydrogenase E2 component (dihydrolipoamide succinyltransferase)